jgi:ABC-type Fe3+-hydroxamate transport system substrate-binding protein
LTRRVVSLVPSATETLLAWGITPVAVTRFCEQPGLPTVGGTKDPDVEAIAALAPDLVVMCREENRLADAEAVEGRGLTVHDLSPGTVAEVGPALRGLAAALGMEAPPADPTPVFEPLGLRAFVPIWRRPWMTMAGDTYGSSVLAALGIANVYDEPVGRGRRTDADRYPAVTLDEVAERRPDLVLVPSEPYSFKATHVAELAAAVAPVVPIDGQDLFWWGARTPAALGRLHLAVQAAAGKMTP